MRYRPKILIWLFGLGSRVRTMRRLLPVPSAGLGKSPIRADSRRQILTHSATPETKSTTRKAPYSWIIGVSLPEHRDRTITQEVSETLLSLCRLVEMNLQVNRMLTFALGATEVKFVSWLTPLYRTHATF